MHMHRLTGNSAIEEMRYLVAKYGNGLEGYDA